MSVEMYICIKTFNPEKQISRSPYIILVSRSEISNYATDSRDYETIDAYITLIGQTTIFPPFNFSFTFSGPRILPPPTPTHRSTNKTRYSFNAISRPTTSPRTKETTPSIFARFSRAFPAVLAPPRELRP